MPLSRKPVFVFGGLVALLAVSLAVWRFGAGRLDGPTSHAANFELVALAKKARNAVVLIKVFDSSHHEVATGSGFFVSDNGLLITNAHVIENAVSATAKTESGEVLPIKGAIRVDRENDLAVLAVEGRNLPFLTLGQSEFLQTGDRVAVIGSPLGLEGSLSEGIIAAKRKETSADRQWLQITAPISPGSSGSPVLDSTGEVIGIATLVLRDGQLVNFAVPAEVAVAILDSKDKSKVHLANFDLENKAEPQAPIPLEAIARASVLDNDAAELAVLRSPEYEQAEQASLKATAAALGNSIGRYEQADWAKALSAANALVAKYPDSGSAYAKLASIYEQMGLSDEAIAAYQHALKLKPQDPGSWDSLGRIYKQSGKITQADFAFSQAIACQTKLVQSRRVGEYGFTLSTLGDMYREAGNMDAAKQTYLRDIQENSQLMTVFSMAALERIYLTEGNEKAAFDTAYQRMLRNPNHRIPEAEAWDTLASWYYDLNRDEDGYRCKLNAQRLALGR